MKKIFTLLAVSAGLAAFAPVSSQAFDGHRHGSSSGRSFANNCGSCGTPVYRERVVIGRDRHGCPVFGYRTVSHVCRPVSHHHHGHGPVHGGSMGHFGGAGFRGSFGGHAGHR